MKATRIETTKPITPNHTPAFIAIEGATILRYHQVMIAITIAARMTKVTYCAVIVPVPAGTKAAIAATTLLTK